MSSNTLEGLWRLVVVTSRGVAVESLATHRVFRSGETWTVEPGLCWYCDDARPESTIELEPAREPPRLTVRTRWIAPGGAVERTSVMRGAYAREGDSLRIAWASNESEPNPHDELAVRLERYERETDPSVIAALSERPGSRERPRYVDEGLGELAWDGNLRCWTAPVEIANHEALLTVEGAEEPEAACFVRARHLVEAARARFDELLDFAVEQLLDQKNELWLEADEEELSGEEFRGRLSLESLVSKEDGTAEVWLEDGELFWGHAITISLDEAFEPRDVEVAG